MNNNIEAKWYEDILAIGHFCIKKDKDCMYSVYEFSYISYKPVGNIITSDISMSRAVKRAKMLETGYKMGYSEGYSEAKSNYW